NELRQKQNSTVQYCFPDSNLSCKQEVRTGPAYMSLFIFLSCISVCTVFLNLLVIISISHFKQLHTPTNLLILSLSVADLLVGLVVMPMNIIQLMDSCWYFGKIACSVYPLISFVPMAASLCSLILIAIERYIAVCDPLLYSTRITVCRTTLVIILGWSLCLFYIIIYLYINNHLVPSQIVTSCNGECVMSLKHFWVIVDLVVSFIAPCCIILILYSIIFQVARRQAKAVKAMKKGTSCKHRSKASGSSQTKAAKKLGTVIFFYLLKAWLQFINSSVNPLIYAIFYSWFRASVKYIVTCRIFEPSSSRSNLLPDHS
uniref:G-protein coupled receptors family 1 profile domain-containing protein n=1 Tax=Astyanax mexicanus TaxID=7994 RepID=A0A8B9L0H9_ASTMX